MSALHNFARVTPFIWLESNAEAAADFYLSVFPNSHLIEKLLNGEGKVLTVAFNLDGQQFTVLNGGPYYQLTGAISFMVRCDTQADVDYYWSKLTEGGSEIQCGWLKDKFGVTWQVVPVQLPELIKNPKVMQAMMPMKKLDIATLERAAQES